MSEQGTQPNPPDLRAAAAQAVAPDPLTAELLKRHSAGEKLTQAEYGKLSWVVRLKNAVGMGKGNGPDSSVASAAPGAGGEEKSNGASAQPPDSGLVRRTTGSVLTRIENFAARKMDAAVAGVPGLPAQTVTRLRNAARLPNDDKELLVDLSPDVWAACGLDPKHYPILIFTGVLGLWATDLWLAIDEVKQVAAKQRAEQLHAENKTEKVTPVTKPFPSKQISEERIAKQVRKQTQ